jgi:hypothetical protein
MQDQQSLIIKMITDSWQQQLKRTSDLFTILTDEQLMQEAAPGRNRGIYLLGHLTAVHDRMLPLLNLADQLYPELDESFLNQPDKAVATLPEIKQLRFYWKTVNDTLNQHMADLQPADWLLKHNAVSAEAFINEPHRNRLNVLISRTTHLASHYGQLLYLKS